MERDPIQTLGALYTAGDSQRTFVERISRCPMDRRCFCFISLSIASVVSNESFWLCSLFIVVHMLRCF